MDLHYSIGEALGTDYFGCASHSLRYSKAIWSGP